MSLISRRFAAKRFLKAFLASGKDQVFRIVLMTEEGFLSIVSSLLA
jgi:hypothetical protein